MNHGQPGVLVEAGADLNHAANYGRTLFAFAWSHNQEAAALVLVQAGAIEGCVHAGFSVVGCRSAPNACWTTEFGLWHIDLQRCVSLVVHFCLLMVHRGRSRGGPCPSCMWVCLWVCLLFYVRRRMLALLLGSARSSRAVAGIFCDLYVRC